MLLATRNRTLTRKPIQAYYEIRFTGTEFDVVLDTDVPVCNVELFPKHCSNFRQAAVVGEWSWRWTFAQRINVSVPVWVTHVRNWWRQERQQTHATAAPAHQKRPTGALELSHEVGVHAKGLIAAISAWCPSDIISDLHTGRQSPQHVWQSTALTTEAPRLGCCRCQFSHRKTRDGKHRHRMTVA